jgi:hypothetical protein
MIGRVVMDDTREQLAAYAHKAWSGWMEYLFSQCKYDVETDTYIIPQWAVNRWQRQILTSYSDLPEQEKDSDRAEADKMLAIVRTILGIAP